MTRLLPSVHPSSFRRCRNASNAKALGAGSSHPSRTVRTCSAPAVGGTASTAARPLTNARRFTRLPDPPAAAATAGW
jgi:hypothetical protein